MTKAAHKFLIASLGLASAQAVHAQSADPVSPAHDVDGSPVETDDSGLDADGSPAEDDIDTLDVADDALVSSTVETTLVVAKVSLKLENQGLNNICQYIKVESGTVDDGKVTVTFALILDPTAVEGNSPPKAADSSAKWTPTDKWTLEGQELDETGLLKPKATFKSKNAFGVGVHDVGAFSISLSNPYQSCKAKLTVKVKEAPTQQTSTTLELPGL